MLAGFKFMPGAVAETVTIAEMLKKLGAAAVEMLVENWNIETLKMSPQKTPHRQKTIHL